jgi:hypothetical protein
VGSKQATAHEFPTRHTRNDDSLIDIIGLALGAPWRIAIATRQALDPIGLSLPELLHVVEFAFLHEVDGRARVV